MNNFDGSVSTVFCALKTRMNVNMDINYMHFKIFYTF